MSYTELQPGDIAPSWQLQTLEGEPAPSLESLMGKPVLILFWNLGCPGCKSRALPVTKQMREIYPDLQVIGVHTHSDNSYSPRQVQEMQLLHKLDYPMYQDVEGGPTFEVFQAEGTPHWVLIDKDGKMLRSVWGSQEGQIQRLDYLLREQFAGE